MSDANANVPSEKEQLEEARNGKYKDAGRDVLLDALNSPIQAVNMNLSRRPENQPTFQPEKQIKWGTYHDMPAVRGHRSGWIY
jgi:hypothetical protein